MPESGIAVMPVSHGSMASANPMKRVGLARRLKKPGSACVAVLVMSLI